MCDYSLHLIDSRPAKVGDHLEATDFARSITRGFSAVGEPEVAVCLLPGTEIAFEQEVQYDRAFSLFGKARVEHKVARFRQVNMDDPHVHHDALEFPGGQIVLVTRLLPGQHATVLQLPASGLERNRAREAMPEPVRATEPMAQQSHGIAGRNTRDHGDRLRRSERALSMGDDDRRVPIVPGARNTRHAGVLHQSCGAWACP
jgi:hypothetical protein